MQILGMLIFLVIWAIIFWVGSIGLEATGLERKKARFQALSALTGCGFTTSESESIVNNRRRRRIVTWLIFLGSVGIVAFLLFMILYLRSGIVAPTRLHIGIFIILIIGFALLMGIGVFRKITDGIVKLLRRGQPPGVQLDGEMIYQTGDFVVTRISISGDKSVTEMAAEEFGLHARGITILAIEGKDRVIYRPKSDDKIIPGDKLLCYGRLADISDFT